MGILHALAGCFLGVLTFYVLNLVFKTLADHGEWSTGLVVALCLIWTWGIGYVPGWWAARRA